VSAPRIVVTALSTCPALGFVWRRPGAPWVLTVVCRATFVLRPGRAVLAPKQHLPVAGDRGYPDGSSAAVYAPSDLVPRRGKPAVIVAGGRAGAARIAVGSVDKRAPGASLGPTRATPGPADWQGQTLPADLEAAGFDVAPPDQRLDALRGDEPLILEGLHPEHASLTTQLPGATPIGLVEGPGGRVRRLAFSADTLWIDATTGLGALVFRGEVDLGRGLPRAVLVDLALPADPRRLQSTMGVSSTALHKAALPFLGGPPPAPPPPAPPPVAPPPMVPVAPSPPVPEESPWTRGLIAARPVEPLPLVAPLREVPRAPMPEPEPPRGPRPRLTLLWFEVESAPRVWRDVGFRALLDARDERLPEPDELADVDVADREDRRDLLEILACGEPLSRAGVSCAFGRSVSEDGRLSPPVALVAGDLMLSFDPRERLKALASALAPHAADQALKAELTAARAFLAARGVGHGVGVCALLADRLREAARVLPDKDRPPDLDGDVDRGLLDARAFARRSALGGPHVRAALAVEGESLAVYLPKPLADRLPRATRLSVRLLVAVHPGVEPPEPVALRVLAAALVSAPRG
jgi:hypothetical protein